MIIPELSPMKNTPKNTPLNLVTPVWMSSSREVIAERQEAEERFQMFLFPLLLLGLGIVVFIAFRAIA